MPNEIKIELEIGKIILSNEENSKKKNKPVNSNKQIERKNKIKLFLFKIISFPF